MRKRNGADTKLINRGTVDITSHSGVHSMRYIPATKISPQVIIIPVNLFDRKIFRFLLISMYIAFKLAFILTKCPLTVKGLNSSFKSQLQMKLKDG